MKNEKVKPEVDQEPTHFPAIPRKPKEIAEKVLIAMKEVIQNSDMEPFPEHPAETDLGRHGSFYFPRFPESWEGNEIHAKIDIEEEVRTRFTFKKLNVRGSVHSL